MDAETLATIVETATVGLSADWAAVYGLAVDFAQSLAEFFGARLWEDGSWGQTPGPSGCLAWLGWGCS